MTKYSFTSLTRITNLPDVEFAVEPIAREQWQFGDYVVGEVMARPGMLGHIELATGRTSEVMEGSYVVGAFARREATLETNGDWRLIGDDMRMEALGSGGSLGRLTSKSPYLPEPLTLLYRGHVLVEGQKRNMADYVPDIEPRPFNLPVVLIVGTSMSAGKTTVSRIIIRELKEAGLKVVGAKLTGAGRYRDILSMRDAGADEIFDFVDVGLSTTICEPEVYLRALRQLLSMIMRVEADITVVEAGASPLEPYNGTVAVEEVSPHVRFTVLCATDPYAALGLNHAYEALAPDIVAGPTANTQAGINLVQRLVGLKALNLLDRESSQELRRILREKLDEPMKPAHSATEYSGSG